MGIRQTWEMPIGFREINWDKGLCQTALHPDWFHLDDQKGNKEKTEAAINLCSTPCPILGECYNYGYVNKLDGVLGGTTTRQRNKARTKAKKLAAAEAKAAREAEGEMVA